MKPIFLVVFLQMTFASFAQEAMKRSHFGFSITPQYSLQPLGASQVEGDKLRFCLGAGGDFYYDLNPGLQVKSGLSFQLARINYRDYSPLFPADVMNGEVLQYNSYYSYDLTQYFVGVPVEAKLKLSKAEKVNHFFLSGGFRFQYLIHTSGSVQLIESGLPGVEQDLDEDLFEFNSFWTLLTCGIGYEWKAGNSKFSISPVFDYSLTEIFKEDIFNRENGTVEFFGIRLAYYR